MQAAPTSVDGALIAFIVAVATATPILINKLLVPLGTAWIARINVGTNRAIANMAIFQEIQAEVGSLRTESLKDKKRIFDLEQEVLVLHNESSGKDITILSLRSRLAAYEPPAPH